MRFKLNLLLFFFCKNKSMAQKLNRKLPFSRSLRAKALFTLVNKTYGTTLFARKVPTTHGSKFRALSGSLFAQ